MFLTVRYEEMSLNEQMQHRIGNLPAFRIFSQASALRLNASQADVMISEPVSMSTAACWGRSQKQVVPGTAKLMMSAAAFRGGGLWLMGSRACRA